MHVRVLDLDGSITGQRDLVRDAGALAVPLREWGPRIRLACSRWRYRRFEQELHAKLGADSRPALTLYGSGDFHHVSLALLRRLSRPFNLLVLDNHPDWMRGVPVVHCGTWLYHALRSSQVRHVFHVGGDVDFDNAYRWMAPWPDLRSGRVTVFPAVRSYRRGGWRRVDCRPLRDERGVLAGREAVEELLAPHRDELARRPLYVSLDKDVMVAADAVVNWDSGHLTLAEVRLLLEVFIGAAGGRLAGMDVVGDWSPVRLRGWLRWAMHLTEHPSLTIDPAQATRRNQEVNRELLETVRACCGRRSAA